MTLAHKLIATAPSAADALYVEDVFEIVTWVGNGTSRKISTRNDLTDGDWTIMWRRVDNALSTHIYAPHVEADRHLRTAETGTGTVSALITSLASDGFNISNTSAINLTNGLFTAWLFKHTPKFFTRVSYTGTGTNQTLAHDLACIPGMIWVKCTSTTGNWCCYNRGVAADAETDVYYGNATTAPSDVATMWNDTAPTDTDFYIGTHADVNTMGETYDAYLFAHDDNADGIIQCGGKTYGSDGIITLGWEPQLVYTRRIDAAASTFFTDVMNGFNQISNDSRVIHLNSATTYATSSISPRHNGFDSTITTGQTVIYMAIRRGLMRTPTDASDVFDVNLRVGTGAQVHFAGPNWPVDLWWCKNRGGGTGRTPFQALRIRGTWVTSPSAIEDYRLPTGTGGNVLSSSKAPWRVNAEIGVGAISASNESAVNHVDYFFRRAKGFFDFVRYYGTGAVQTISHNLGVVPDFVLVKRANVASVGFGCVRGYAGYGVGIFGTTGTANSGYWNDTDPTATEFTVGTNASTGSSGSEYLACLFASVPGVCKIGTYVSDGSNRSIAHGFAAPPRFILIKSITATTSAVIFDSDRGINTSANEPQIILSSTNAESSVEAVEADATNVTIIGGETSTNVNTRTYMYIFIA